MPFTTREPILKCDRKLFLLLVSINKRSMLVYSKTSAIRATSASRHFLMNDCLTHINISGKYAWHNTFTMVSATHELCPNWRRLFLSSFFDPLTAQTKILLNRNTNICSRELFYFIYWLHWIHWKSKDFLFSFTHKVDGLLYSVISFEQNTESIKVVKLMRWNKNKSSSIPISIILILRLHLYFFILFLFFCLPFIRSNNNLM